MREVSQCPICDGITFTPFLKCKDHTVSHETFILQQCIQCGFLLTSPIPETSALGQYYISESYVSHSAKAKTFFDKLYVLARKVTLTWKARIIKHNSSSTGIIKLMDVGCGTGSFLEKCKSHGWQITGVEPSDSAREQAIRTTNASIHSTLDTVEKAQFDAITLWHVLEHIPDLSQILEKLNDKLAKTGTMFIAVPNRKSWDANHYKTNWAAYDVPRHLWHFSQHDMERLLNKHHFKLIDKVPMKLDAFYIAMLSEKYQNNNKTSLFTPVKSILKGLTSNILAATSSEYSSLIYIVRK